MTAHLRKIASDLSESFWPIPALMVLAGIVAAIALVQIDRAGSVPVWLTESRWLYDRDVTGAR